MKKVFAGDRKDSPISLIEALISRGLLEDEELSLEKLIEYCAEHIAEEYFLEEPGYKEDCDGPVGEDWEYGGWTVEWEGNASCDGYYQPATHDSPAEGECLMVSCEIKRAEAWRGNHIEEAVDVKEQLQAALNPLLEKNRQEASRLHRY